LYFPSFSSFAGTFFSVFQSFDRIKLAYS
jgi:hypothetical protein